MGHPRVLYRIALQKRHMAAGHRFLHAPSTARQRFWIRQALLLLQSASERALQVPLLTEQRPLMRHERLSRQLAEVAIQAPDSSRQRPANKQPVERLQSAAESATQRLPRGVQRPDA